MHKAEVLVIFVALAVAAFGIYYLGPAFTGFVIKESSYSDKLNIVAASNGTYIWEPKIAGELKYLKLDGSVTIAGKAKAYVESNGIRYLIFDSSRLNETAKSSIALNKSKNSGNSITGFSVKDSNEKNSTDDSDKEKQKTNRKPEWIGHAEFIVNRTADINLSNYFSDKEGDNLEYSASADEIEVSLDGEIASLYSKSSNDFNTTATFIASDGISSTSHVVKIIFAAEKKSDESALENSTSAPPNETINNTNPIINEEKSIKINLEYNSGTIYDANDNGEESINGVVDLNVNGTSFGWDGDKSRLCTKWEVYSLQDNRLTTFCNGNADCCAFLGLLPTKNRWNEIYYSTFGRDGAGYDNLVSAQVIYYDVNLSSENIKSEIYYSEWGNLSVRFFKEENEFYDACIDTCSLKGLNKSSYKIFFDIEDGAVLKINNLKYAVSTEISNNPPALTENFSAIRLRQNRNITINLSKYFSDPDGDVLAYDYYKADNITILFENNAATIVPDRGFDGSRLIFITANDSQFSAVSNLFFVNVSEEKFKPKVEIGKPVKWTKKFLLTLTT